MAKTKGRQFRRVADSGSPVAHFGEHTFTFPADWLGRTWVEYLVRREQGTAADIVEEYPDEDGAMQQVDPAPWIHHAIFGAQYADVVATLSGIEIENLGEMLLLVYTGSITVAAFNGDDELAEIKESDPTMVDSESPDST